jgi:hypothetical protein
MNQQALGVVRGLRLSYAYMMVPLGTVASASTAIQVLQNKADP